jgi:hypothetical protein
METIKLKSKLGEEVEIYLETANSKNENGNDKVDLYLICPHGEIMTKISFCEGKINVDIPEERQKLDIGIRADMN